MCALVRRRRQPKIMRTHAMRLTRRHCNLSLSRQGVLPSSLWTSKRASPIFDTFVPEYPRSLSLICNLTGCRWSFFPSPTPIRLGILSTRWCEWHVHRVNSDRLLIPFSDRPSHKLDSSWWVAAVSGHVYTKIEYNVTCHRRLRRY